MERGNFKPILLGRKLPVRMLIFQRGEQRVRDCAMRYQAAEIAARVIGNIQQHRQSPLTKVTDNDTWPVHDRETSPMSQSMQSPFET
jgi:hypothetical protein